MHRSPRSAFSLPELLTVIALLAIVMALVTPAVTGMGRASALAVGGNTVANLVTTARQRAISGNTMTALILLTDQGSDADYRALAVAEYTPGRGWSQVGKWEVLPVGISVDASNLTASSFLTHSPQPFPFINGIPKQENPPVLYLQESIRENGYAARIFLPNGGLQNPEYAAQIRLVEGVTSEGQTQYTHTDGNGQPPNYYDVAIVGATGLAKINRP